MPEEIWFYLTITLGVTTVALIVLFLMEREKKREMLEVKSKGKLVDEKVLPATATRTVPEDVVKETKSRLRVLDVEREILSYAVRRLYEAHAEGKITAEERDNLALKYREDLERIRQEIARGESIIALNELERMQEEFIKMFSEKLEVLNRRIEELRSIAGLKPLEKPFEIEAKGVEQPQEQPPQSPQDQPEKAPSQRKRKEPTKPKAIVEQRETRVEEEAGEKGEADKRIEEIMTEIEKVLNKLSQMEVEE